MQYYSAPMQGITTWLYRQTHQSLFGGVDRYYTPFFSPTKEHLMTARDLRDLDTANNIGVPVVPQIMTRRAEDFLWAARYLKELGYSEVNLNLGCPSGTVVSKGKGSGFLGRPAELDAFFDTVFSADLPVKVSVKTRLGLQSVEEFPPILEIYNRYPIEELTIHPRLQKEFYKFRVHMDAFDAALQNCTLPVCYNGDLRTQADCERFSDGHPSVHALMLGRALITDPALLRKLRGGAPASREELERFTDTLYEGYARAYGSKGPATQRMKELWFFLIWMFEEPREYEKRMRRLRSVEEYERVAREIFRDLPLRQEASFPESATYPV